MEGPNTQWEKPSQLSALLELKYAEHRWQPEKGNETDELLKIVRRILNKLTPQNYVALCTQFLKIPIKSESVLSDVLDLIIQKAVNEPVNTKVYANLCKISMKIEVVTKVDGKEEMFNFRKLLISKLQNQFELHATNFKGVLEEQNNSDCEENASKCIPDDKIRILRTGNVRFLGELYKLNMLSQNIIFRIIDQLLTESGDISLECLAVLMKSIGKTILFGPVSKVNSSDPLTKVKSIFKKISDITQRKKESNVSSRVRFMLLDILDLPKNHWKLREENNCLKTMDEIIKELKEDSIEISLCYKYSHLINQTNNLRVDLTGASSTATTSDGPTDDDGWNSVGKNNKKVPIAPSTAKTEPVADNSKRGKKKKSAKGINKADLTTDQLSDADKHTNYQKMIADSFDPSKLQIKPQDEANPLRTFKSEPPKRQMTMDQVQAHLLELLRKKKGGNYIFNFIMENVGDRLEDPQLLMALVTAICESDIRGLESQAGPTYHPVNFKNYKYLIKRFIQNKAEREVVCLNAIHNLVVRLNDSIGLIANIFHSFLVQRLITEDSFFKWRDEEHLEQKEISVSRLSAFFTNLERSNPDVKVSPSITRVPDSPVTVVTPPSDQISLDQVQQELTRLMREKKQYNQILNFILDNVKDVNLKFTRALVTAFCEACISDSCLDRINFKRYEKLIKRFVTDNESRKQECLNAVLDFVSRQNHSEDLISDIFNLLLDDRLISTESFLNWRNESDDLKDKASLVTALNTFFSTLEGEESGVTK